MVRQYVGARYVPKFATPVEWAADTSYEALTIVTFNNASYTSKVQVPPTVGNPANNPQYWALTGNYNAQVEQYRQETENYNARVEQYRQETENIKINYSKCFDTAANMIADTSLTEGMIVKTLGYNKISDNGGAFYKIYNTKKQNSEHYENLSNGKYALLITNGYITPEMFGAAGDGENDDTQAIINALATNKPLLMAGTYKITSPVTLEDKCNLLCTGELIYVGDDVAVIIKGSIIDLVINKLTSNAKGIAFKNTNTLIFNNNIRVDLCNCGNDALYFDGDATGVQNCMINGFYNSTNGNALHVSIDANQTHKPWFNENHFLNCRFSAKNGYGIYLNNEAGPSNGGIDSNYFDNDSVEGSKYFLYLNNAKRCSFISPRTEEVSIMKGGNYKYIFMNGQCDDTYIQGLYGFLSGIENNCTEKGLIKINGHLLFADGTYAYNEITYYGKDVENFELSSVYRNKSFNILNRTFTLPEKNDFTNRHYINYIVAGTTLIIPSSYLSSEKMEKICTLSRYSVYADVTIQDSSNNKLASIDNTGKDTRLIVEVWNVNGKIQLQ